MSDDEHQQSGASKLLNSLVLAMCIAPLMVIGSMFLLGWNEKRAACTDKALNEASGAAREVGCTDANAENGKLIVLSCDIQQSSLPMIAGTGDFDKFVVQGTGLKTTVEMRQCVEHESTKTVKDDTGKSSTVTTYSYSVDWVSHYVDSTKFQKLESRKQACGSLDNPNWDGLPTAGTTYAGSALIGAFKIEKDHVSQVPLSKPAPVPQASVPQGWAIDGEVLTTKKKVSDLSSDFKIGEVRVGMYTNDHDSPTFTILGKNNAGTIGTWTSSDTWLCSGESVSHMSAGKVDKAQLFSSKKGAANALTWFLRFMCFACMWFACSRFAAPLGVVADCIPCIGPMLGDMVDAIACCVACAPACACSMMVGSIVWVAMRPVWGALMMVIFCAIVAGGVAFKMQANKAKEGARDVNVNNAEVELGSSFNA